jgi:hypothetical protein
MSERSERIREHGALAAAKRRLAQTTPTKEASE